MATIMFRGIYVGIPNDEYYQIDPGREVSSGWAGLPPSTSTSRWMKSSWTGLPREEHSRMAKLARLGVPTGQYQQWMLFFDEDDTWPRSH
jgi:hypothetical protein